MAEVSRGSDGPSGSDGPVAGSVSAKTLRRVAVLLLLHLSMLAYVAVGNAPVCDEVAHLTAGFHHWRTGHFWLYRVNPPLVKLVASLPAALGSPAEDWSRATDGPGVRSEFDVGRDFLTANRPEGHWYHTAGRLLCLPFTVFGGWMCFVWANALYGERSGLLACALWCFSPTVLGWGSTFTPDAAATSFGLAAAYRFRGWLLEGSWRSALTAGLSLGVALLCKTTWVVLFVVWPVLAVVWVRRRGGSIRRGVRASQLLALFCCAVYVMNVGYGFERTCERLGDFDFVSQVLNGRDGFGTGNRFRGTILGRLPVPLPANYIRGVDLQKLDFERGMDSFLFGRWSDRGWWYYYPVAASLEMPVGTIGLVILSAAFPPLRRRRRTPGLDELALFVPALTVFVLVCSQTGFGRYVRYLLPCLPAAFVFASRLAARKRSAWVRAAAACLVVWSVGGSLWAYPHSMSYFNELAGGPGGGHRYLLDANVDWGQDVLRLRNWARENPSKRPLFAATTGFVSPYQVGLESTWPRKLGAEVGDGFEPEPGWYAISVHELFQRHEYYVYLRKYPVVDRVGFSIWVIRVD